LYPYWRHPDLDPVENNLPQNLTTKDRKIVNNIFSTIIPHIHSLLLPKELLKRLVLLGTNNPVAVMIPPPPYTMVDLQYSG
jgi:hypothetical protein